MLRAPKSSGSSRERPRRPITSDSESQFGGGNLPPSRRLATCSICLKQMSRGGDMKRHMKTHEKDPEKRLPHVCTDCGRGFGQKGNLNEHKKSVHSPGLKTYQCALCPEIYTTSGSLWHHENKLHGRQPGQLWSRTVLNTPSLLSSSETSIPDSDKSQSDTTDLWDSSPAHVSLTLEPLSTPSSPESGYTPISPPSGEQEPFNVNPLDNQGYQDNSFMYSSPAYGHYDSTLDSTSIITDLFPVPASASSQGELNAEGYFDVGVNTYNYTQEGMLAARQQQEVLAAMANDPESWDSYVGRGFPPSLSAYLNFF